MSDVNVPLLQKTLDWAYGEWQKKLRGEVSEWHQGDWTVATAEVYWDNEELVEKALSAGTACGTSCCIAGKVALDAGWKPASGVGGATVLRDGEFDTVRDVAIELLGVSEDDATRLFYGQNTIYDLYLVAEEITGGQIVKPPALFVE